MFFRPRQPVPPNPVISFCTPVKGRLEYLKHAYVHNLLAVREAGIPAEFVLVDYDSPDGMAEWAKATLRDFADLVSFYRVTEPRPNYYIPVADNTAMKLGRGEIVSNLMADTRVTPAYFRETYELISKTPTALVRAKREANPGTAGLMTLWKEKLLALGGYDEEMKGWGYQDVDLRHRCEASRMKILFWSVENAEAMQHDDALRNKFADVPEAPQLSNQRNIERSKLNLKKKWLVANVNRRWGEAPVERVAL